jgi:hypothetical protein
MNKLTLSLTPQEVKILTGILEYVLTGVDLKTLRTKNVEMFLRLACLHEFYNKMDKKNKELAAFGYTPGKDIKVIMRRFEALAFFLICNSSGAQDQDSYLPALPTVTELLITGINGDIHKHFLI